MTARMRFSSLLGKTNKKGERQVVNACFQPVCYSGNVARVKKVVLEKVL